MNRTYKATCHCGAVELAVEFPDGLGDLKRCNCSLCRRKGAIMAYTSVENLRVVKGADKLSLYTFHTHTAKHYFCSICGIYTHHQTRVNPNLFGVNTGCIEGLRSGDLVNFQTSDGINHPMDAKS